MARFAAAIFAGVLLGVAAWGQQRAPVLAFLLPAGLALCESRAQAFAFAAGYAAGMLRYSAGFAGGWFDDSLVIGWGVVLVYMAVTGAAWCAGWSKSPVAWRRASQMAVGWLLALGPAAIAAPGHPLIAAGFLVPGTGWFGVATAIAAAAGMAAVVPPLAARMALPGLAASVLAVCLAGAGLGELLASRLQTPAVVEGVTGITTSWGPMPQGQAVVDRITAMGSTQVPSGASVVAWPESVIGLWEPPNYAVMDLEVLRPARRAGRTIVVGMDIEVPKRRFLNSAVAFFPDGTTQTAVARQPAPLSTWRPWRSDETFLADWTTSNMLTLGDERAAVIFCYEEYMPVLYLLNEAKDHPTMYLALANTWAARQRTAATIQSWHSIGMARLFGRPYVKAENQLLKIVEN